MKKIKYLLLLTFIIGSITSCGYQLRGSINIEGLQNINIIANNYGITRILEQRLLKYKKDNLNQSQHPSIRILSVDTKTRQLSVNSSGRVDEYEINRTIKYQFTYSEENVVTGSLKANASYDFNESQMQGTRGKENSAIETINRTLARKLLLRFQAGFKANST